MYYALWHVFIYVCFEADTADLHDLLDSDDEATAAPAPTVTPAPTRASPPSRVICFACDGMVEPVVAPSLVAAANSFMCTLGSPGT